jgi:hypothetical protein
MTTIRKLNGKIETQTQHINETNDASATNIRQSVELSKQHLEAMLYKQSCATKKIQTEVSEMRSLLLRRENMNVTLRAELQAAMTELDKFTKAKPVEQVVVADDDEEEESEEEEEAQQEAVAAAAEPTTGVGAGARGVAWADEEEMDTPAVPLPQRKSRRGSTAAEGASPKSSPRKAQRVAA